MAPPSNQNIRKTENDQWSEWAVLAQSGDKKAYSKLLSAILPFIRNYLVGGLANPDWADDVTQDVLISVHKSLRTYGSDRPFRPWLMAIISFRRTDFLRKYYSSRQDKQASLDNADFLSSHVTNTPHAGELKDVEGVLLGLPEKQRKIFELIKIQGYTAKEVANQLDMSVSAVKVSAHRTMKKIQNELG